MFWNGGYVELREIILRGICVCVCVCVWVCVCVCVHLCCWKYLCLFPLLLLSTWLQFNPLEDIDIHYKYSYIHSSYLDWVSICILRKRHKDTIKYARSLTSSILESSEVREFSPCDSPEKAEICLVNVWVESMDFIENHICLTTRQCPLLQQVLGDKKFITGLGPVIDKSTLAGAI